jgi:hypothetical protein
MYDDRGGSFGGPLLRLGKMIPRAKGARTPCSYCPKIPQGRPLEPASAVELSPHNAQAYQHYLECRAVGQFPDDPIVRRNAVVIRKAEDLAADRKRGEELLQLVKRVGK